MDIEEMNKDMLFRLLLAKLEDMEPVQISSFSKEELYKGWKRTVVLALSEDVAAGLLKGVLRELIKEQQEELEEAWRQTLEEYRNTVQENVFAPPAGYKFWMKFFKALDVPDREINIMHPDFEEDESDE